MAGRAWVDSRINYCSDGVKEERREVAARGRVEWLAYKIVSYAREMVVGQ